MYFQSFWVRPRSQLGTRFSVLFLYTSCLVENEVAPSMFKNTTSENWSTNERQENSCTARYSLIFLESFVLISSYSNFLIGVVLPLKCWVMTTTEILFFCKSDKKETFPKKYLLLSKWLLAEAAKNRWNKFRKQKIGLKGV